MKTARRRILSIVALVLVTPLSAFLQDSKKPADYDLQKFFMFMLKKGPKWTGTESPELSKLMAAHVAHILELGAQGKVVLSGPVAGDGDLLGVGVFSVPTMEDARAIEDADPAVKAGQFRVEIIPWYAAKGIMRMPGGPLKTSTYYLGFLKKGSTWAPGETPELRQLQEAHLANIRRLHEMGKLVIAGPLDGNGNFRGVFVFKTDSVEEAKALAATDPMIKIGRLAMDIYSWSVPAGSLP
jgi:uncharacterized protein YciI